MKDNSGVRGLADMEALIISAMLNDGEYPVENVGKHATQIAKILTFNGYTLTRIEGDEDSREFLIDWITAYKDGVERNALAETPKESADYLLLALTREPQICPECFRQGKVLTFSRLFKDMCPKYRGTDKPQTDKDMELEG